MNRDASRLWCIFPAAAALIAFSNTMPGDFVYDDVVLIERSQELKDFDLRRIFLQNYWGPERTDRNYRPLTLLSYALNYRLSEKPGPFHAVNVVLNAAVAVLAYLVLLELLREAPLAALGATIFAVLPVHVEAVANIVGRAELLAALAIFGVWLCALKTSARAGRPARESWKLVLAASAVTFLGLLAKENVIIVIPLIVTGSLALRRAVPWRTVIGAACAAAVYLAVRTAVLAGKQGVVVFTDNPIHDLDPLTRVLNAVKLLGLYIEKIAVPVRLSANYSFNQLPELSLAEPRLWAGVLAVTAPLCFTAWFFRRRSPLVTLSAVFFCVAFATTANVIIPIGTNFAERLAYTPSFAFVILLCAAAAAPAFARWRGTSLMLLGALAAVYGARTWVRNADWTDRATLYLRLPIDAPLSAQSYVKASEGYLELRRKAKTPEEKEVFIRKAEAAIRRSIEIYSESGKAEAKLAEILYHQGRYEEGANLFTHAIEALFAHKQMEPVVFRFRGECLLRLSRFAEAEQDFDRYVKTLEAASARPDAGGFNFRGLARAFLGRLDEALADFNRALELRRDWPELWNNRGMCKLKRQDFAGAIEDWKRGLELCRAERNFYQPSGDSAFSFLEKIASAYLGVAKAQRAAGDEEAARAAEAEAAKHKEEAKSVAPGRE